MKTTLTQRYQSRKHSRQPLKLPRRHQPHVLNCPKPHSFLQVEVQFFEEDAARALCHHIDSFLVNILRPQGLGSRVLGLGLRGLRGFGFGGLGVQGLGRFGGFLLQRFYKGFGAVEGFDFSEQKCISPGATLSRTSRIRGCAKQFYRVAIEGLESEIRVWDLDSRL